MLAVVTKEPMQGTSVSIVERSYAVEISDLLGLAILKKALAMLTRFPSPS